MKIFTKIVLAALLLAITVNLFACEDGDGEAYIQTEQTSSDSESVIDSTDSENETTDTDTPAMGAIGRF